VQQYLLTINFHIEAVDTVDAREKARVILQRIPSNIGYVKFQRLYENEPPKKINLETEKTV